MIHFMSLIRPSGLPSAAPPSAGTGTAGGGQPVNVFAALVQKLLGDLQGGTASPAVGAPVQSILLFAAKGAAKSASPDPAGEKDARSEKYQSKEDQGAPQPVSLVQQPDLMQVLNLAPPPAGTASTAGSPVEMVNTDGSVPSEPGSMGVVNSSPVTNITAGKLPDFSGGQASFSHQSSSDAGIVMLPSFFKDVSTFGIRVPLPPGSPLRNFSPGQAARVQQDQLPEQMMTPEPAIQPDKTITAGLTFQTDQSAAAPLKSDPANPLAPGPPAPSQNAPVPNPLAPGSPAPSQNTAVPNPLAPGSPAPSQNTAVPNSLPPGSPAPSQNTAVPNPLAPGSAAPGTSRPPASAPSAISGAEWKSGSADPSTAPGHGMDASSLPPPQIQSPARMVPAISAPEIVSPGTVDPTLLPRIAVEQPRKGVDPILPASADARDGEGTSRAGEAPPAKAGFFTSMVSDVLGIFSKNGAKSSSSDPQGNGPDSAPLVTNNVPSGSSAPSFVDIQAQPAKKSADGSGQDSAPVSAADAARPVRDQVDLSALRTAQVAQVSQAVSDKTDTVGTAAPLRDLPSPYAPLPAEVSRRIADQVVQNLKLQVDGTTSDIRMTLKPPSLGEVQLSVHVEDSRMQAQINVTQQVVKTALEAHMPQLRQALQDHGIEVQRIDVMLPEPSLQHDGTGANGERAGRREGRRLLAGDDTEAFREAKDMGYNTIELIM